MTAYTGWLIATLLVALGIYAAVSYGCLWIFPALAVVAGIVGVIVWAWRKAGSGAAFATAIWIWIVGNWERALRATLILAIIAIVIATLWCLVPQLWRLMPSLPCNGGCGAATVATPVVDEAALVMLEVPVGTTKTIILRVGHPIGVTIRRDEKLSSFFDTKIVDTEVHEEGPNKVRTFRTSVETSIELVKD